MSSLKSLTLESFEDLKKVKGIYLLDFWATWCPPCKVMNPILDKLNSDEDLTNITFLSVDVDEQSELQEMFDVTAIPTFYLLNIKGDGSFSLATDVLNKIVGAHSEFDFKLSLQASIKDVK